MCKGRESKRELKSGTRTNTNLLQVPVISLSIYIYIKNQKNKGGKGSMEGGVWGGGGLVKVHAIFTEIKSAQSKTQDATKKPDNTPVAVKKT